MGVGLDVFFELLLSGLLCFLDLVLFLSTVLCLLLLGTFFARVKGTLPTGGLIWMIIYVQSGLVYGR